MISHHIDPDGDVILTLHNPNQAFAVWHPSGDASTSDGSSISDGSSSTGNPSIESTFIEVTDDRDAVRFQLSSKHLTLASNYFKNTLTGPWKESIKKGGQRDLNDYDWSEKALLIVLNIIHGRNRDVPNRVSRHLMTEIAAITDYYQCHEAIELWYKDVWWDNNRNPWDPQNYGSDLIKRLFVAWVFYEKTVFRKLTRRIAIESQGPIQTRNLVFPIDVINQVEKERQRLVSQAIKRLQYVQSKLQSENVCTFVCSSMNLGAFMKQMESQGLLDPRPQAPFLGYSIDSLIDIVGDFEEPSWIDVPDPDDEGSSKKTKHQHECKHKFLGMIKPQLSKFRRNARGLNLDDIPPSQCSRKSHSP